LGKLSFLPKRKTNLVLSQLLNTPLGRLRLVAFLEGCSFLLIGLTMILKYQYAMPKPNYVVGMAHGVLFITYVLLVLQVAYLHKWSKMKIFWAFVASLVPFGTFYAEKHLYQK
jgi:integral membrane protein